MDVIRIEGLTKRYRDTVAVDNLSLSIRKGELFSLLGVNGAGKTTVIKVLTCLTLPTEGDAYLNGMSIRDDPSSVKSIIAVSPQETAVAPNLSVRENLELICGVHGFTKDRMKRKVDEMIDLLKLDSVIERRAKRLSGGWQRRVSIAMALITEPEILFLDEPTLGLDVIARSDLWDIILALKGKVTIVLTTHYMEEAKALSDRVAIMKDGRLLVCDTPEGIEMIAGTDDFEKAFIHIIRGAGQ